MQTTTTAYDSAISASVRKVKAKAELYSSSALAATYTESDKIINFDIQRVGEDGKFFGFGICHRLNLHLIDVQRQQCEKYLSVIHRNNQFRIMNIQFFRLFNNFCRKFFRQSSVNFYQRIFAFIATQDNIGISFVRQFKGTDRFAVFIHIIFTNLS